MKMPHDTEWEKAHQTEALTDCFWLADRSSLPYCGYHILTETNYDIKQKSLVTNEIQDMAVIVSMPK